MNILNYSQTSTLEWRSKFVQRFVMQLLIPAGIIVEKEPLVSSAYLSGIFVLCGKGWSGLILGLRPANKRRRYFVTTSLIGWVQA